MDVNQNLVILGGGLTGHAAAMAARGHGFEGGITIVSAEEHRPYDRTPLSKAVLQGQREPDDLYFMSDEDYAEHDITCRTGANAVGVDFDKKIIELDQRDSLTWDTLLIATGCDPIRLDNPGFDLPGVHYLRRISDAVQLRDAIDQASRVLVIGASFIGSEVAASARVRGADVVLVDRLDHPMQAALGDEIGSLCASIHQDHGVDLRMGTTVTELRGTDRVERAVFDDGTELDCDLVVVGVGVRPNVELFDASKLEIENGILVDEYCRTSIPGVYAAGDVANWWHPEREQRIRIEHFDNAGSQGTFAGKVIAGASEEPFAPVPFFWSDQYDTNIQFVGFPTENMELIIRGNPDDREVTGFYIDEGGITAAVTVNHPRNLRSVRRLVRARAKIDSETLKDPETDLRALSREYS